MRQAVFHSKAQSHDILGAEVDAVPVEFVQRPRVCKKVFGDRGRADLDLPPMIGDRAFEGEFGRMHIGSGRVGSGARSSDGRRLSFGVQRSYPVQDRKGRPCPYAPLQRSAHRKSRCQGCRRTDPTPVSERLNRFDPATRRAAAGSRPGRRGRGQRCGHHADRSRRPGPPRSAGRRHPDRRAGVALSLRTVRIRTHALTVDLWSAAGEFYDLVADPGVMRKLFEEPQAELAQRLLLHYLHRGPDDIGPNRDQVRMA